MLVCGFKLLGLMFSLLICLVLFNLVCLLLGLRLCWFVVLSVVLVFGVFVVCCF